jgi:hypothetical protein
VHELDVRRITTTACRRGASQFFFMIPAGFSTLSQGRV